MGFGGVGGGGGERSSGEWKSLSGILVGLISFSEQILFSEQMNVGTQNLWCKLHSQNYDARWARNVKTLRLDLFLAPFLFEGGVGGGGGEL